MATSATLNVDQGATYRVIVTLTTPSNPPTVPETEVPLDLTGAHARMTVRPGYGQPSVLDLDDQELGGITLGGTAGTVTVELTAQQTGSLPVAPGANPFVVPFATFVFDIAITLSSGDVTRGLQGVIVASGGVTFVSGTSGPQ